MSAALGLPVVNTVAVNADGAAALLTLLDRPDSWKRTGPIGNGASAADNTEADHETVRRILQGMGLDKAIPHLASDRIDRVVLHPLAGPPLLAVVLFLVFQAVFAWAETPMNWIETATHWLGNGVAGLLPSGWLQSLVVDGVIAGAGGVVVFLPQIIILFFFILVLEESGYLPRAAFLLDRLMGGVGLSGRSFIPLLSSFACAIPGIMAARTITNTRDRLVTIMIAPMMTCSARLPVYALLIGAFIPQRKIWGGLELQGLVLFCLYVAGIVGALLVAWLLKRFTARNLMHPLMMELPIYHVPRLRNIAIGLWQRVMIFMKRVGGIILVLTVLLWFLASFPVSARGRDRRADRVQLRRHAGTRARRRLRAHRLQLADQHLAGTRPGRTRSRGERARYRLCPVGHRQRHRRRPQPAHRPQLEPGHRLGAAGLVRLRAAVPGHARHRQARNRRLEPCR